MIRADIFETGSLAVLKVRSSAREFRGVSGRFAAKMRSNYLNYPAPDRKLQEFRVIAACGGD